MSNANRVGSQNGSIVDSYLLGYAKDVPLGETGSVLFPILSGGLTNGGANGGQLIITQITAYNFYEANATYANVVVNAANAEYDVYLGISNEENLSSLNYPGIYQDLQLTSFVAADGQAITISGFFDTFSANVTRAATDANAVVDIKVFGTIVIP